VLKVSDYKSALIQGKFLAKKGIWISEYRIESGLNCGGHAFATGGHLLGPILAEFRDQRDELTQSVHEVLVRSLAKKNRPIPAQKLALKITAQGGVGTAEEHRFLLDHYKVDSVGWGSPFLLVPEVTTIDDSTLNQLIEAKEEDLYLSDISPLGIPFNSLRNNTKDIEKLTLIARGKPGSPCTKRFAALSNEFSEKTICTASRKYQSLKIKELDEEIVSPEEYLKRFNKIVEKSCICVGLGTSALMANNLSTKTEGTGVSVCPGPNIAYFTKRMTLSEITDHICGRTNMISRTDRPNIFINELKIYIDFLRARFEEMQSSLTIKQEKYLITFLKSLEEGINYYSSLFNGLKDTFADTRTNILSDLQVNMGVLNQLKRDILIRQKHRLKQLITISPDDIPSKHLNSQKVVVD